MKGALLERPRISASPVVFEIAVDRRPARVAIDLYYRLIDRDCGDNVHAALSAARPVPHLLDVVGDAQVIEIAQRAGGETSVVHRFRGLKDSQDLGPQLDVL
jgi:hypothetical protein